MHSQYIYSVINVFVSVSQQKIPRRYQFFHHNILCEIIRYLRILKVFMMTVPFGEHNATILCGAIFKMGHHKFFILLYLFK